MRSSQRYPYRFLQVCFPNLLAIAPSARLCLGTSIHYRIRDVAALYFQISANTTTSQTPNARAMYLETLDSEILESCIQGF